VPETFTGDTDPLASEFANHNLNDNLVAVELQILTSLLDQLCDFQRLLLRVCVVIGLPIQLLAQDFLDNGLYGRREEPLFFLWFKLVGVAFRKPGHFQLVRHRHKETMHYELIRAYSHSSVYSITC
jgi:hypothetical protein